MKKLFALFASGFALLALLPLQAGAITNGQPDNNAHPYVGELLFYVPDESDPRFSDPGAWFTCTGTLLNSTIVITAGHCTYGVGHGGNDVWINFSEAPDFSMLAKTSTFTSNAARYAAWSAALNGSSQWHRATAFPHPQFDPNAFALHDAGVLRLATPEPMSTYGRPPTLNLLDGIAKSSKQHFTPVGYGLEESGPKIAVGGDTRRVADSVLVGLNGVHGAGKGVAAQFSNDNGAAHQGGTCFGDSGGPIILNGTSIVTAVNSFTISDTCTGSTNAYRLDQPDDLAFLASFGVTP